MELQNYINSSPTYISDFRKQDLKVNSFKDLKIISYPYDKTFVYNDRNDLYKLFLRGAVITKDNKVICLPPIKSLEMKEFNEDNNQSDSEISYESLIDGTMINLFHHNDTWTISTRSEIGGYNKWLNKKSFRQMFDECSGSAKIDYDVLDKNMSYSFVMKHKENRNVTPIYENELILVEVYKYLDNDIIRLDKCDYPDNLCDICVINDSFTDREVFMKNYQGPVIPYHIKGFTIKTGSLRYKWINPYFNEVKDLKINMNNHLLNYIELRRNNNLKKYLRYYPEHQHLFNDYKEKLHNLSNELYTTYKNVFVHRTMDKKEIPYHLKPLIYDIHRNYLDSKQPTTWQHIKDYIHNMPSKKLVFAMNYC